jgi:hypothetical protein
MKLPPFLDLAYLLSAIPYPAAEPAATSELIHEDFRLTLLAPVPTGLPTKPFGYLLLAHVANEAKRRKTRELAGSLPALCRALGAHELADDPKLVEEQLRRLGQTLVRVEVKDKNGARTVFFPLFSQLALDAGSKEGKTRWQIRLSGDFLRVLRHTAPTLIRKAQELPAPE